MYIVATNFFFYNANYGKVRDLAHVIARWTCVIICLELCQRRSQPLIEVISPRERTTSVIRESCNVASNICSLIISIARARALYVRLCCTIQY